MDLSVPPVARTKGRYLFQSSERSSPGPLGGTMSAGVDTGEVSEVGAIRRFGARRSNNRRRPSAAAQAIRSG